MSEVISSALVDQPNEVLQFKVQEYKAYSEEFGPTHERTLFIGCHSYLEELRHLSHHGSLNKPFHLNVCLTMYKSMLSYIKANSRRLLQESGDETAEDVENKKALFTCLLRFARIFLDLTESPETTTKVCNFIRTLTNDDVYLWMVDEIMKICKSRFTPAVYS